MVVLAAAAVARAGADVDAVAARAREASDATKIWFAVDTLEYLRRGGRIGAAQAWIGGALKIKPILTLEGEIAPVERVRTSGRAFERMVDYLRSRHADGADGWMVQHIQAPDQAERLVVAGREIFDSDGVRVRLPLTHQTLGHLVGSRRPSVSVALGALAARGELVRDGNEWLLRGPPPALDGAAVDAIASALPD